MTKTPSGQLIYLRLDQLKHHPRNLRRAYPEDQVREMADSIRGRGGVIHALIVVTNGTRGHYFVVDGNLRLEGGLALGTGCPPLKCEVVDESQAQQLLDMAITSCIRYAPDPISEALHFRRLMEEEGYTAARVASETGIGVGIIRSRLRLLDLDPEIQELVAHGKLPKDVRIVDAFASVPDRAVRVKLALRLARDGVGARAIAGACGRAAQMLTHRAEEAAEQEGPALAIARRRVRVAEPSQPAGWDAIRTAALQVCGTCEIKAAGLRNVAEPAWELISHAAQDTCSVCNVRQVRDACNACPLPDLLRRLLGRVETEAGQ